MPEPTFPTLTASKKADICLLLEGTYPYVRGGVSSWVHQLIIGHPNFTFALIFVGASKEHYPVMHYELPNNVCHFERHFLSDDINLGPPEPRSIKPEIIETLKSLYEQLSKGGQAPPLEKISNLR